MCLFPVPNNNLDSLAYRKGVHEFNCGACPECLHSRASLWALRACFESKLHQNSCMITLTYDSYKHNRSAHPPRSSTLEENKVNPNLTVNKRDVQLFIKRLRKKFGPNIKYIACAEYGSRTHRAHYHLILFGVKFPDLRPLKRSKRRNQIYYSKTLTDLWTHGITTVDSIYINPAIARYCTKYCAKTRTRDTFMLFSHHLGEEPLLQSFNGLSYILEGREYPIPRNIWNLYITRMYPDVPDCDYHYINPTPETLADNSYYRSIELRRKFRLVRDSDVMYQQYLNYWSSKAQAFDALRPPVLQRIFLLPDTKYHNYKTAAIECYRKRSLGIPAIAPGSGCISRLARWRFENCLPESFAPSPTCPNRANDTDERYFEYSDRFSNPFGSEILTPRHSITPKPTKLIQIKLDF